MPQAARRAADRPAAANMLGLQRAAGNRAVAHLATVQRQDAAVGVVTHEIRQMFVRARGFYSDLARGRGIDGTRLRGQLRAWRQSLTRLPSAARTTGLFADYRGAVEAAVDAAARGMQVPRQQLFLQYRGELHESAVPGDAPATDARPNVLAADAALVDALRELIEQEVVLLEATRARSRRSSWLRQPRVGALVGLVRALAGELRTRSFRVRFDQPLGSTVGRWEPGLATMHMPSLVPPGTAPGTLPDAEALRVASITLVHEYTHIGQERAREAAVRTAGGPVVHSREAEVNQEIEGFTMGALFGRWLFSRGSNRLGALPTATLGFGIETFSMRSPSRGLQEGLVEASYGGGQLANTPAREHRIEMRVEATTWRPILFVDNQRPVALQPVAAVRITDDRPDELCDALQGPIVNSEPYRTRELFPGVVTANFRIFHGNRQIGMCTLRSPSLPR